MNYTYQKIAQNLNISVLSVLPKEYFKDSKQRTVLILLQSRAENVYIAWIHTLNFISLEQFLTIQLCIYMSYAP